MCETNALKSSKRSAILARRRHTLRGSAAVLLRVAPVALAALSFTGQAHAQSVTWSGGAGSWFDTSKWTDDTSAQRLPTSTDNPVLVQSPGIVTINGQAASAGRLQVLGGGEVDLTGGGTLSSGFLATIGLVPSLVTNIPSTATSGTGSMLISGAGSAWNASTFGVRVGNTATGTLTVSNGGALNMDAGLLSVGMNAGGSGTLKIDGGTVSDTAGALRLGYDGASGTTNITNGGTLTTTMTNNVGQSDNGSTSSGTVTISGAGSSWTITNAAAPGLNVGNGAGATGTITVSAGATLSNAGNAFIGYNGAAANGGTGSVTITGTDSTWNVGTGASGSLVLGYGTGSTGTVTISAGATLNTAAVTIIGYNDGTSGAGTGTLTVDGSGTTWNSLSDISVGGTTGLTGLPPDGNGTLNVSNGATVNAAGQSIYIATLNNTVGAFNITSGGVVNAKDTAIANGAGTSRATIDGQNSALNLTNNLVVGFGTGTGTLAITNGGTASAQGGIFIAQGGNGTVTVDGQGSKLSTAATLFVADGDNATGALTISNGAVVTATSGTRVGTSVTGAPANGTLTMTSGAQLNSGALVLGFQNGGNAAFNMSGASTVNLTGNMEVGFDTGTATATVTGQGTTLNTTGVVFVGHDLGNGGTTGTMTVADGAVVNGTTVVVGFETGGVGTLNIGTGGASGIMNANIEMGGASSTVNFNHNDVYTYSGVITDSVVNGAPASGSVNFTGTGTTIFTNANTYTSATNINSGELQIAAGGSIANSILTTVNSGARLSGAGTVGDVMVASGGTIAPTGTNTLTVRDITFAAGSTYQLGINAAGQNGSIAANTATLQGGTVRVNAGSGNYAPGTTYTILNTTGGVTGQFAGLVATDFAFLQASLNYADPDAVNLALSRNGAAFASVATTSNQASVASGVASLATGSPVNAAVVQQNAAGARTAFDALSGEAHASAQAALINNALVISDTINNRFSQPFENAAASASTGGNSFADEGESASALNYAEKSKKPGTGPTGPIRKAPAPALPTTMYSTWAQGFGSWINRSGDGNAAEMKSATGGVLSGVDVTYLDTWRFGLAGGYSHTNVNVDDRSSSLDVDSYHIAGYAGTRQGRFGLQGGVTYSWNDISSSRTIAFPGFLGTAQADYNAGTTQVFGEANYTFVAGGTRIEPFAGLSYINHHADGFNEFGSAAALNVAASDRDTTFSTVGTRASAPLWLSNGVSFVGRGTLGWRHVFGDTDTTISAAFAGGSPFSVAGTPLTADAMLAEAGLDMVVRPDMSIGVSWTGQFGDGADENRLQGQFTYRW